MTSSSATRRLFLGGALTLVGVAGVAASQPRFAPGWIALAAVGWCLSIQASTGARCRLGWLLAAAVVLRIPGLLLGPALSDDVYRYAWEGELVLRGENPYTTAPDAPELAALRAELPDLHARLNHPEVSAAYPPLAQGLHAGLALFARGLGQPAELLIRLVYLACDLLVLLVLARMLERRGLPIARAVVWGFCPLVALEFAGSGHLDSLGILLLLLAWVCARERSTTRMGDVGGAVLLACGVLVKYVPVVALPALWRESRARALVIVAAAVVLAAGLLPLVLRPGAFAGLAEYGERWEGMNLLHRWIHALVQALAPDAADSESVRLHARIVSGVAWLAIVVWAWRRWRGGLEFVRAAIGGFLLLTPVLHPWYLCWMLPFQALRIELEWLWLCAAAPLLYATLERGRAFGDWSEPAWLWPVFALPFFALFLAGRLRARKLRAREQLASPLGTGPAS